MTYRSVLKFFSVAVLAAGLGFGVAGCDRNDADEADGSVTTIIQGADQELLDAIAQAQALQGMPYPFHTLSGDYLAGRLAADVGDMERATDYLTRAMNKDKENLILLQTALPVSVAAGDFDSAVALSQQVYDAKNLDSHLGMVILIAKAVKDEDYVTAWKYADEMSPGGLGMYLRPLLRAWLAAGDKSLVTAETIIKAEIKKQPLLAALYYTHLGLLSEYRSDAKKADDYYKLAIARQMSVRMAALVGSFYEHNNRSGTANEMYSKFIGDDSEFHGMSFAYATHEREKENRLPPKNVNSIDDGIALALFDLASVLHQEKATRLALLYSNIADYLRPEDDFNHVLLGDIYLGMGNAEEAQRRYQSVPATSDIYDLTQFRLADVLEQSGSWKEAVTVLDSLSLPQELQTDIAMKKADIFRRAEQYDKAIPLYSLVIESKSFIKNPQWGIYYSRALCYEQTDEWDLAEKDLLKAMELDDKEPLVLNYLGYTWADKGIHIDKALEYIRKASDLAPNDGYIADSMGWVLFRLGRYDEAEGYMEKAVSIVPNDPIINDHVGDVYWVVGRKIEARYQWQRALDETKDAADKDRIREKIQNGYDISSEDKIVISDE